MLKDYVVLLRPHQYSKNLFIFLPLFFAGVATQLSLLGKTLWAFVVFSLIASAVYIFNDYRDIEEDRKHPKKQKRPLAAGRISKKAALIVMSILLLLGMVGAFFLDKNVLILVISYFLMNIAYSLKLKHIPILDIFIIAIGFILRLFVGAAAASVVLSMWIFIMTFLLALFLAIAKRRDDILLYRESGEKVRRVIDGYNLEFVNLSMGMMASVIIVSYIMYTISPEVIARINNDKLYITVIFVILGVMRYMQISFVEENSGSPTEILLKDRFIQLTLLGWLVSFTVFLY